MTSGRSLALALSLLATLSASAGGRPLAPRPYGPSAYAVRDVYVAHAGGTFLTVWEESIDYAGERIVGAISDARGRRQSVALPLVLGAFPRGLAGHGRSFALLYVKDTRSYVADVSAAGVLSRPRMLELTPYAAVDAIAWNGSRFLVAWHDQFAHVAIFDDDGHRLHDAIDVGITAVASGDAFFAFSVNANQLTLRRIDAMARSAAAVADHRAHFTGR